MDYFRKRRRDRGIQAGGFSALVSASTPHQKDTVPKQEPSEPSHSKIREPSQPQTTDIISKTIEPCVNCKKSNRRGTNQSDLGWICDRCNKYWRSHGKHRPQQGFLSSEGQKTAWGGTSSWDKQVEKEKERRKHPGQKERHESEEKEATVIQTAPKRQSEVEYDQEAGESREDDGRYDNRQPEGETEYGRGVGESREDDGRYDNRQLEGETEYKQEAGESREDDGRYDNRQPEGETEHEKRNRRTDLDLFSINSFQQEQLEPSPSMVQKPSWPQPADMVLKQEHSEQFYNEACTSSQPLLTDRASKQEHSEPSQSLAGKPSEPQPNFDLNKFLPQQLDDGTMAQEASCFFTSVDDHVENFYHDQPIRSFIPISEKLGSLIGEIVQEHVDYDDLLANTQTRFPTISSLVCARVLHAIRLDSDPENSLLPRMVAAFLHDIPKEHTDSHAYQISLSRWRTSTAFLLKVFQKTHEHCPLRDQNIQTICLELDTVLNSFVLPEKVEECRLDLIALAKRGERLGLSILSQPAAWEFQWNISEDSKYGSGSLRRQKRPLVVFPAFQRTTDNKSRRLEPPYVVLEKTILE